MSEEFHEILRGRSVDFGALEQDDPGKAKIVMLGYFASLTEDETAAACFAAGSGRINEKGLMGGNSNF